MLSEGDNYALRINSPFSTKFLLGRSWRGGALRRYLATAAWTAELKRSLRPEIEQEKSSRISGRSTLHFHGNEDKSKIKLETTRIKANKELPQILYIVPWKDFDVSGSEDYKIKLHDLFGDLYDPLLASSPTDLKESAP